MPPSPDTGFTNFILKHINKKYDGFFIEAGANDGYVGSVCYVLENGYNWSGINIEPNRYCFKKLVERRPDCINLECALYNKVQEIDFRFPTDAPRKEFTGGGSIIPDFGVKWWPSSPEKVLKVKTQLLKDILEEYNIVEVDLLILDVQGAEIEALEGMVGGPMPNYICVEDSEIPMEDLISFTEKHGYNKITSYSNNTLFRR